jgi:hypothetical protein
MVNYYCCSDLSRKFMLHKNTINIDPAWTQEPVIRDYFLRLNQGDFSGVSQLFSEYGCLHSPFQSKVCGRDSICNYLQAEAREMTAVLHTGSTEARSGGITEYELNGQVHTKLFTVNVSWTIELNADKEILAVTVKLLAQLQELLGFRQLIKQ